MEHFVKLVEALAWPSAAVWLGYIFSGEIRKLIGRVSTLKYKDLEAKFDNDLVAAEEEAKKVMPAKAEGNLIDNELVYPSPYNERYEQLLRIADESPRAALIEAWIEVEDSLVNASEKFGKKHSRRFPPRNAVLELINTGKYAKTILPLFENLRDLRNEAVHAPQFVPTKRQTRRYLQMAIELSLTLQNPLEIN
jgi:hypothetical protein